VLLSGGAGLGLEPVSEVGGTAIHCPDADGVGDGIGGGLVEGLATAHLLEERGIGGLGEGLCDLLEIEDVLTKELGSVDGLAIGLARICDGAGGTVDVVLEGLDAGLVCHGWIYICTEKRRGRKGIGYRARAEQKQEKK